LRNKAKKPLVPAVRGVILIEQSQNVELQDEEARAWHRQGRSEVVGYTPSKLAYKD